MKTLDRLIEILCSECGEKTPDLSEEQKPNYFRALCNVRPPRPASAEFLRLQDIYLSEQTRLRGIADVENLTYVNNMALWQGDMITLNADAIVNACNSALLGCFQPLHNCIDNRIHSFAGVQVRLDCNDMLKGGIEQNGQVKVTKAYNLPSKFIFHTVGPIVRGKVSAQNKTDLANCYISCLNKAKEMRLKSIAFCCISTGIFGYPKSSACELALETARHWQAENGLTNDEGCGKNKHNLKIIFDVYTDEDRRLYENKFAEIAKTRNDEKLN